jgi:hypothetical protein
MNMNEIIQKPVLVESGTKYFLGNILKNCKEFKNKYYDTLFNIFLLFIFLLILGIILLYKYKGKLTPSEKAEKEKQKMQYILSKIKNYQEAKRQASQELITGLPMWENEYDNLYHSYRGI